MGNIFKYLRATRYLEPRQWKLTKTDAPCTMFINIDHDAPVTLQGWSWQRLYPNLCTTLNRYTEKVLHSTIYRRCAWTPDPGHFVFQHNDNLRYTVKTHKNAKTQTILLKTFSLGRMVLPHHVFQVRESRHETLKLATEHIEWKVQSGKFGLPEATAYTCHFPNISTTTPLPANTLTYNRYILRVILLYERGLGILGHFCTKF